MRRIVADASALLPAWLPDEKHQAHADRLIQLHADGKLELCAPALLAYEILNGLHLAVRGKAGRPPRLTLDGARERWQLFQELQIVLEKIEPEGTRALELASEYQLASAYDAAYLALAEQAGAVLVTADERLLNVLQGRLGWVKALWDFEPSGD